MTREMLYAIALGYLLGSIPFGLLLARSGGKGDVRDIGSGNIGATNVLRTGSKGLAALTLMLDCLKATAAILLARQLWGDEIGAFAAAGAMLGHLYPVWLGFKGGKGVATLLGVLIALLPLGRRNLCRDLDRSCSLTSRISSLAGMGAAISAPISALVLGRTLTISRCCSVSRLLVLWKHRENIRRLMAGTEPSIGKGKV